MTPQCSTRGCRCAATHEIEIRGPGAEFVTFTCEVCGKEFRRRKTQVDWNYEHRGILPRFCSQSCKDIAKRKGYKSPYARNIERIKKEVGR